jgi:hypothetical protein
MVPAPVISQDKNHAGCATGWFLCEWRFMPGFVNIPQGSLLFTEVHMLILYSVHLQQYIHHL